MGAKTKLKAKVADGELVISVGVDTLCYALKQGDGINGGVKITDKAAFAKWFADEVIDFDQDETGTSALERVFDRLAVDAVEGAQPFVAEDGHSGGPS